MVRRSEWKNIVRICQGDDSGLRRSNHGFVRSVLFRCLPQGQHWLWPLQERDGSPPATNAWILCDFARVRCYSHGFNTFDVACLHLWVQRRVTLSVWALWLKLLSRPSQASHRRSQGWDAFVIVVEVYCFFVSQSRVCVMTKIWQYFLYGRWLQNRNVEARSARFPEIELVAKEKKFRGESQIPSFPTSSSRPRI